ncbi:MAG: isochorismate synthase [Bacteroidia bacterium]|nr:isochorismate synthase [Bacteroidia bacterium]
MSGKDISLVLDALIEQDACFAIYRLPGEQEPRFVMQTTDDPLLLHDFEQLNEKRGFVIAPFRITPASPLIVIHPDCTELSEVDTNVADKSREKSVAKKHTKYRKSDYDALFQQFHKSLLNGEIMKLVLSRSKTLKREDTFSPGQSFLRAAEKYIHSFVYLFHTPQSGTWLGSTPEILLAGSQNEWQTVALAGTRFPNSGNVSWDDKNLREQHLVTSYILKQLTSFQISPEINGPYTVKAGSLAHLRTDFSFSLPDNPKTGTLLKTLHPTPAVSGLPKDKAFQFILEHEGYDRRYYTGFLGMIDPLAETNLYVNLRCMQIEKNSLTLFAGSGLLSSSTCKDEWKETEQKLKTMASIVK